MELAAESEKRSRMTPAGPMYPGDWLLPVAEMGLGRQVETSEEEDFRMGLEHPNGQTGLVKKVKI